MFIYGYSDLSKDVNCLRRSTYTEVFSIGRSLCGRNIICIKCGLGKRKVLFNGTHHGSESITAALLMRFAEELNENPEFSRLLDKSSIYIIPMVNPDGAELVKSGCEGFFNRDFLIKINGGSHDFTNWQANARGVDLNHNYDAGWDIAKRMEKKYGADSPCRSRFGGFAPHSEPETKVMVEFSRCEKFDMSVSFHTQGKEIYYEYLDYCPVSSKYLAEKMADASGYSIASPSGIASYGGYKDWFIKTFSKPAFTIEAGLGKNPLPFEQLDEIYNDNRKLLAIAAYG